MMRLNVSKKYHFIPVNWKSAKTIIPTPHPRLVSNNVREKPQEMFSCSCIAHIPHPYFSNLLQSLKFFIELEIPHLLLTKGLEGC